MMEPEVRSTNAPGVRSRAEGSARSGADERPIAEAELRLIRVLQHRGRLVAHAFDDAPSVRRLVEVGLVRAVERPGAEVILVLSGDGLRLAHRSH